MEVSPRFPAQERIAVPPLAPTPLRLAILGLVALIACVTGGLAVVAAGNGALPIDSAWHDYLNQHQTPVVTAVSLWLNDAGAQKWVGFAVPAILAATLLLLRRPLPAAALLAGSLVTPVAVYGLKAVLLRPRPTDTRISVTLTAYPSGHVANLVVVLVLLGLILARGWFWVAAFALTLAMAFSRTYLDAHWLTDTVGGALLGAAVALLVWSSVVSIDGRRLMRAPRRRTGAAARTTEGESGVEGSSHAQDRRRSQ